MELVPSPKFQLYEPAPGALRTDVFVNETVRPGQPTVSFAVKLTEGGGFTVIDILCVLLELPLKAVNVTV